MVFFSVVFHLKKAMQFSMRFILVFAVTMPAQDHLSQNLSGTGFTGSQLTPMQKILYANVMVARSMLAKLMSRLKS